MSDLAGKIRERPTLTYDGEYHCAQCGMNQTVLCEHWQVLFKQAIEAKELAEHVHAVDKAAAERQMKRGSGTGG